MERRPVPGESPVENLQALASIFLAPSQPLPWPRPNSHLPLLQAVSRRRAARRTSPVPQLSLHPELPPQPELSPAPAAQAGPSIPCTSPDLPAIPCRSDTAAPDLSPASS